ncbi:hypothetical protein [Desulfocurvus sp. DL9XJH121]
MGWFSLMEGRRVAKTASTLYEAKECLLEHIFYSNTFPSYTGASSTGDPTDNTLCSDPNRSSPAMDVDNCICNLVDAWGQPIYILEGIRDNGAGGYLPISGTYVLDNEAQGQNATAPSNASTIIDKDGVEVPAVAFVLVSFGRDREADNQSYRDVFTAAGDSQIAPLNPADPPDFSEDDTGTAANADTLVHDDQMVVITGAELNAELTR